MHWIFLWEFLHSDTWKTHFISMRYVSYPYFKSTLQSYVRRIIQQQVYLTGVVVDIVRMSHNLIVWSFPFEIKYLPSPRLSINAMPSRCPQRIPAGRLFDIKHLLSQTYRNKILKSKKHKISIPSSWDQTSRIPTLHVWSSLPENIRWHVSSAYVTVFTSSCSQSNTII